MHFGFEAVGSALAAADWNDDDDPRLERGYARLIAHPQFAAAVQTLAANMLTLFDEDRALRGIFKDAGRYVAAMVAASLHREGVTLARLRQLCAGFGLLSPGRAHAMLAYLAWLELIELWPERDAAASRRHRVSERFLDAWGRHLVAALAGPALIDPIAGQVSARLGETDWLDQFTEQQIAGLLRLRLETEGLGAISSVFLERDAGSPILWLLISEGQWSPGGGQAVTVSTAAMASRFGVSRMHVSRMLGDARRQGLLADGPGLAFTARGRAEIGRLFGLQIVRLLASCQRTLATLATLAA